ncbi:hypothetical protein QBC35DRAFT_372690 [Podospora australis]|uniref:Uncharacterized protein n=1 Tax=Podospora australis TaxID=1536484 RepID=A0AAN6X672_9PEZI|nr:hypothetical protein QBC35DRAFT_372690 [Podospora australis]
MGSQGIKNEAPHLGDSINTATRAAHTRLNKGLLIRLPLAVPPRACNPTTYVSGILHIAPIYLAFESVWQEILDSHEEKVKTDGDCGPERCAPDSSFPSTRALNLFPFGTAEQVGHDAVSCERIHAVLSSLHLPGLMRADSILRDIRSITGWSEEVAKEQVEAASQRGRLGEFTAHIKRSIKKNPEVLLAYAWVLYMALFSGGRFIRSSLEAAGPEFWGKTCDPVLPLCYPCSAPIPIRDILPLELAHHITTDNPLTFFRFPTPLDGEDLKMEFKKRLLESETLLLPVEREHVVREAVCIFDNMNLLVSQLDNVFSNMNRSPSGSLDSWASLLVPRVLGGRLRDSVAVAKERGMRVLSRRKESLSEGDEDEKHTDKESFDPPTVSTPSHHHYASPEKKLRSPSMSEASPITSTSSVHAHSTLTSTTELVENTSLENLPLAAGRKSPLLVVRFGSEKALLKQRNGAKSVHVKAEGVPETTQPIDLELQTKMKERQNSVALTDYEPAVWTLVLFAVLGGVVWGYGQWS